MQPRLLAFLAALPVALAGCAEDAPGTAFHATGSGPSASLGWAYDGAVEKGAGEVSIDVDEATNQGRVVATAKLGGATWAITWTNFSEAAGRPFQSGGIAHDLTEHGDTNVGDTLVPRVHLVSAGWGRAEVRKDGVPYLDPVGGGLWSAHYMATDTGVRAADGKIKTRTGGIYDPTKPAEGASEADREIWIILRPVGTAPADGLTNTTEAVSSPQYAKDFPITVESPGATITVDFAAHGPPSPLPLPAPTYDLTFTLSDANGTEVQTAKNTGSLSAVATPGEYVLRVTGAGVQSTYDLGILVDYPSADPIVVVYEEANW